VTTPSDVTDVTVWLITPNPNPRVLKMKKYKIKKKIKIKKEHEIKMKSTVSFSYINNLWTLSLYSFYGVSKRLNSMFKRFAI